MHFGSLIAALASYLDARQQNGIWLVRIEDIDGPRVVRGATDAILKTLDRYGLHWDGGIIYQSQRIGFYEDALNRLQQQGLTYFCSCSRRQIAAVARTGSDGARIYPGTCRSNVIKPQQPVAIRIRTDNNCLEFKDLIADVQTQRLLSEVGDFVIRRADGIFAYQLAVVVDDAAQEITDVVRGQDLLDSTPRQIYLQQCLGFSELKYKHLPLVLDENGDKLSKQTGAQALDDDRPVPALLAALGFLQQQPPADLLKADTTTVLQWAIGNWNPAVIARAAAIVK